MMTQFEFDQAVENWTKAWQKGDPLGAFYLGQGVPKDESKAVVGKWKRR